MKAMTKSAATLSVMSRPSPRLMKWNIRWWVRHIVAMTKKLNGR